ncbi:MAG: TonB-dependent receptor [Thermoanaerobaculia bacterium]|nr:TonB-dependent receptor [Thermoanaerobaculia bacterium]
MSRSFRSLAILTVVMALALAWPAAPLLAQSSAGSISGTVADTAGGPLPGAGVTARNARTGATRTTVSNATGTFTFPLLAVGLYGVTVDLSGFGSATKSGVEVNVGGDVSLKFVLALSSVKTAVTVTEEAPLIETTRTQQSDVVNENFIANLPTNGRNFIDFVLTTPGVTIDPRQGDISFAGQRGTLNSLVIDGANNDNTFFGQALGRTGSGRAPYQFSQDAVKEFQVNRNAYTAEYGRAGGAVINVVTKSGTNEYHGSAFEFFRDKGLNANDYINVINGRDKSNYHYNQFGASLGGPILKDRLFFFANYDGQRNTNGNPVILNTGSLNLSDPDTAAGLAKLQPLTDSYDRGRNQDVFLLKADWEAGSTAHVSARYNRQRFTGSNNENGGTTQSVTHSGNSLVNTDTLTASVTSSLSASLFNELRGQYAKDSEPGLANSAAPEAVISGGGFSLTIGRNNFSPRETTITRYQVADAVTFLFGNHAVKGGFDFNRDLILNWFPGNFSGSYTFSSVANYNRNQPSQYLQAFPGAGTSGPFTNPDLSELGLFLLDEWRPTPSLTISLGVRYDKQGIAQPTVRNPDTQLLAAGIDTSVVPEDGNNVGVRLGFAWSPKGQDATVVRGGYGMFYGRTPSIMIGTAHSNNGVNVQTLTFTGAQMPAYPNIFPSIPTGVVLPKPTILVFDPNFENPLVHQASLGIEHSVSNDVSLGLSYLYVKGTKLQRSADINVGSPSVVNFTDAAGNVYPITRYGTDRPFANFARVIQFQSTAESNYNGVTLELNKRFSNNWQGRVAYTFGKVLDTKPDATAVVPGTDDAKYASDPRNFDADYAPGDADQRHRVVLSAYWSLPYYRNAGGLEQALFGGWSLSGIITLASGQAYTPGLPNSPASDLNGDQNQRSDRAPGFGRNSQNYPVFFSFDPRITKDIPIGPATLQLIVEAFNLFNRSNVTGINTTYYSVSGTNLTTLSTYGAPTQSGLYGTFTGNGPRIVQLAVKVIF